MQKVKGREGLKRFYKVSILALALVVGLAAQGPAAEDGPYGPMVVMKIKGLALDPLSSKPIAVLETVDKPHRLLPIWIGRFEANAIALQIENIPPVRPMTHDLIKNILSGLDAKVKRIVITKLEENIFFASLSLETNGREVDVDCRPSDAIAVALRVNAPIYATEKVLEDAKSIEVPEQNEAELSREAFGMTVQTLTPTIAEHFGLPGGEGMLVSHVSPKSRAETAGVMRGDIVTALGSRTTRNHKEFKQAVESAEGQAEVKVKVRRGKKDLDLTLRLGHPGE